MSNRTTRRSGRAGVDAELDLGLQVIVAHQPFQQRLGRIVRALRVEDAAMPLQAHLFLDPSRRCRAGVDEINLRTANDAQARA